jgi:glycosyltransferase involved in cell wall biosynthesis
MDGLVTVVVPAYNEAESLPVFLPQCIAHCESRGWKVVVVNDGSTDGTRKELERYAVYQNVQVLHHKLNRGYGAALKTGITLADTRYVATVDADGQHQLSDLDALVETLQETDADMVVDS